MNFTDDQREGERATTYYWDPNPVLCVIAWMVALGGTAGEGKVASRRTKKK